MYNVVHGLPDPIEAQHQLTTTTRLMDPNFTGLVTSFMDSLAWYLWENYGYSEGKAVSLSNFLPSMSPNTRMPYCTRSEDLTISYSTRAEYYEASVELLNTNLIEFMWRPPWLSKLCKCSPYLTTIIGTMYLPWSLSFTVSPALSPPHLHLHHDQFPVAGGGEVLLPDIFPFWSVVLDLFWMWRAQPELDTVRAVADAPEVVSVVVYEALETSASTVLALSFNCLAPCWLYMDEAAPRLAP
jgi:hypothetical protein